MLINAEALRKANAVRQDLWDPKGVAHNLPWRFNELAGEAGEVCNILKKIYRERAGVAGSRATKDQLADELADVVICVDLAGLTAGEPPITLTEHGLVDIDSLLDAGAALSSRVGRLCDILWMEGHPDLRNRLHSVLRVVGSIARSEGIDLWMAVVNKFNYTSRKLGLTTLLG